VVSRPRFQQFRIQRNVREIGVHVLHARDTHRAAYANARFRCMGALLTESGGIDL